MTTAEALMQWKGCKNTPYDPNQRITVLVTEYPGSNDPRWVARRQAFDLYWVFPKVGDYLRAVEVLTEAGLLDRYADRPVATQDIHWDETHGYIRVD
jgi:hypothetical protein